MIKFGGPIFSAVDDPIAWGLAHRQLGYTAAYCPVEPDVTDDIIAAYVEAADRAGIIIAEVGAWSNPISPDSDVGAAAIRHCTERLALAERIGASCCVNIAGSRGTHWCAPDATNFDRDTFDLIVETVRKIIDAVQPVRTCYSLETSPWIFPHTPESYVELVEAIDRKAFGVHLDIANMVTSPALVFDTAGLIRRCFDLLGPRIVGCHAKDVLLSDRFMVHIDEVRPGLGTMAWSPLIRRIDALPQAVPVMLEHLATPEEYASAAAHIRTVAAAQGILI